MYMHVAAEFSFLDIYVSGGKKNQNTIYLSAAYKNQDLYSNSFTM